MKNIIFNRVPCWYEISWQEKNPAIILRTHKEFAEEKGIIPEEAPIVRHFMKEFGFTKFGNDIRKDFGFEHVFRLKVSNGQFIEHMVRIPKIKIITDKRCSYCRGKGKDKYYKRECFHCDGTGKDHVYDWQSAYAISASFNIYFSLTHLLEKETSCQLAQLIMIGVVTQRDLHGGSLGGDYSIDLHNFLSSFAPRTEIQEMTRAMATTHEKMFGKNKLLCHDFWARVDYKNGWLNVRCPGNACGLNPVANTLFRENEGYEFSCHNVDTPMQQLTLLAGLAALHSKARKEIRKD